MSEKTKYYLSKYTNYEFDDAVSLITQYLQEEGIGVLFTLDMKETFRQKLELDFKNYKILGVCNPTLAKRAFDAEDKIGILLPCNVAIIEQPEGHVEVAVVNPAVFSTLVENDQLECFTNEVRNKFRNALSRL